MVIFVSVFESFAKGNNRPAVCNKEETAAPFVTIGGAGINVDDMNDLLTHKGYKRFKDYSYILGGGVYKKIGRSILEIELSSILWNSCKSSSNKSSMKSLYGVLNYGINVLPGCSFTLFPYVGCGFGKIWLDLTASSIPFDTLLDHKPNTLRLDQKTFFVNAGLGFDVTFKKFEYPLKIGLRAGYAFDPTDANDWFEDNVKVKGGPKINISCPFARIVIVKSIREQER